MVVVIHSLPVWLPQTQNWIFNQIQSLPEDRVEVHVVCERTENLENFGIPNIHSLSGTSRLHSLWDKGLRKIGARTQQGFLIKQTRRQKAQLIHSHFGSTGWSNLEAAKKMGLKHVVTFYGFDVSYLPKSIPIWYDRYQELFKGVDQVLCEGPSMAKSLENIGCPGHKLKVFHLGIKIHEIVFKPRVWNGCEPLRVLIAASFQEKKGIPYALEALGQIQQKAQLEITIIGDANDEERSQNEKRRIIHVLERWGLQDKTRLLGFQPYPNLFKEAYKHHIFLSPSVTADDGDTEGGVPVSIMEMAATGMPVLSTTHCDIPEVVQHGVTGLLVRERDTEGLVAGLQWLMANPDQWLPMVEAGRRHLEAEFDARRQGQELAKIYEGLVTSWAIP